MPMTFVETFKRRVSKKYRVIYKRGPSTIAFFFAGVAVMSWLGFLLLSGFPVLQYGYYHLKPKTSQLLSKILLSTAKTTEATEVAVRPPEPQVEEQSLPERDVSLPMGHYLTIPQIGLDTVIWEGPESNYEEIIKKGVWRVPDLSTPDQPGKPVLLVAHRFGYLEWSNEYRTKNSFFNLPKLKTGDEFEIVWDQRRYKYRVSGIEEGTAIGSYEHDLILYTCKFLVSPVRIFVYAERVN